MGCTQSKIENEETVNRCKDRKMFMKEAVSSRNAFAAAHSSYAMSLKNTGAALSDFAQGEADVMALSSASVPSASTAGAPPPPPPPAPSYDTLPPPPPPFPPAPLQRAATMPEFLVPKVDVGAHSETIVEDDENEDDADVEDETDVHRLKHRRGSSISRITSKNRTGGGVSNEDLSMKPERVDRAPPPPPPENRGMSWDFFFSGVENVPGPSLAEVDEESEREIERKVFEGRSRRSEVIDERKVYEEQRSRRSEVVDEHKVYEEQRSRRSEVVDERKSSVSAKAKEIDVMENEVEEVSPPPPPANVTKAMKNSRQTSATVESRRGGKGGQSMSLLQIFTELDDCFLKAYQSAHDVSMMLEANRLHYHSNFADDRAHIDHSARVMRVITWNRSFRGLSTTDHGNDDFDSEENETHATVLDKMLAWEKKLFDEVKAGEQMKFEYQKKIASLNKLKKRDSNTESLERLKATVSHLHTRYIVDMQSMDSTVSEINRLRDEQLYPKLVALVDAMAIMWENMRAQHENQTKIVQALRSVEIASTPKETSEKHHGCTIQLWGVVQEWHSQFQKLMLHQREYVKALNNWLKLNLIPIDNNLREKVSSPQRSQTPPIQSLLLAWHDFLDKLPEELARTAIFNFAAVMDAIVQHQAEEMSLRDKCEETRKELLRKTRQFEDWYNKYMQKRTPPDEMDPERAGDRDLIIERQMVVEALKKRLEEEEENYQRHCVQVRDKSLTSLRTRLPEVFRAMTDFSFACSLMYKNLRSISKPRNANGHT